jgi:integration host factor subunit alpha
MNRNNIVEFTQRNGGGSDLPRKTVREALDFVIGEISGTLMKGESVKLTGFGTFEVRDRKDRMGRNPKTGEKMLIKSHRAIVFRPARNYWDI